MSRALDVKERTRSVNDKITYAAEVLFFIALLPIINDDCAGPIRPASTSYRGMPECDILLS